MKKKILKEIIEKKEKKIEFSIITNLENGEGFVYEKNKPIVEKARTIYKVLDKNSICSLVEMKPITGRKHQLRKQLFGIGHPIYGDNKYKLKNIVLDPVMVAKSGDKLINNSSVIYLKKLPKTPIYHHLW